MQNPFNTQESTAMARPPPNIPFGSPSTFTGNRASPHTIPTYGSAMNPFQGAPVPFPFANQLPPEGQIISMQYQQHLPGMPVYGPGNVSVVVPPNFQAIPDGRNVVPVSTIPSQQQTPVPVPANTVTYGNANPSQIASGASIVSPPQQRQNNINQRPRIGARHEPFKVSNDARNHITAYNNQQSPSRGHYHGSPGRGQQIHSDNDRFHQQLSPGMYRNNGGNGSWGRQNQRNNPRGSLRGRGSRQIDPFTGWLQMSDETYPAEDFVQLAPGFYPMMQGQGQAGMHVDPRNVTYINRNHVSIQQIPPSMEVPPNHIAPMRQQPFAPENIPASVDGSRPRATSGNTDYQGRRSGQYSGSQGYRFNQEEYEIDHQRLHVVGYPAYDAKKWLEQHFSRFGDMQNISFKETWKGSRPYAFIR